ncbi:ABC transporter ATP-binding protein [Blastopirellula sp. JC732]|uniref:ABC transporter ATP-binding protein n=1 Tax=Blastopirellula sediminis TaxID=2894196 RepID=A0A9X1MMU0_9BACT|nr:ABC transporter ATP-binding protein [Blastopirellula sediminis]MCC9607031.1 ABC transporter ATP-binding protein [Blastopirellula sediminis]MCC9629676.1 ABC transporter ATP-binding protein [Blastopirellula sediminis]
MLETNRLTKRYGDFLALDGVTLHVPTGQCCGVLGPNGAGKTTMFRLILGFLRPTSGSASIDGMDCHGRSLDVHRRLSYLPGDVRLFGEMKGREVLRFFADVHPHGSRTRSEETAQRLDLDLRRRVAFMSTGMRQKLGLAIALSIDAPLLIFDEPTTSLDPNVRHEVVQMIGDAHQRGKTVIICSHVLSEIEDICQRAVIMRQGRIVHDQDLHAMRRRHVIRGVLKEPLPQVPHELTSLVVDVRQTAETFQIETDGDLQPALAWIANLPTSQIQISQLGLRAIYNRYHFEQPEAVSA